MPIIPTEFRELSWSKDMEISGQNFTMERKESSTFTDREVQDFCIKEWIDPQEEDAYDVLQALDVQNMLILRDKKGEVAAFCTYLDIPRYEGIDLIVVGEEFRKKGLSQELIKAALVEMEEAHYKEYPEDKGKEILVDIDPWTEEGKKLVESLQRKYTDKIKFVTDRWDDKDED